MANASCSSPTSSAASPSRIPPNGVAMLDPVAIGVCQGEDPDDVQVPAVHLSRYEWLIGNTFLSDVTLLLEGESGVRFPAHRLILSVHSPTFRAMFMGWQEAHKNEIVMEYSHSTCMCILRHIYCGVHPTSLGNPVEVYDAAVFYGLDDLCQAVMKVMRNSTDKEKVLKYLQCALMYDVHPLRDHCVSFIRQSNMMRTFLYTDELLSTPKEVLKLLVEEAVIDSDMNILQQIHRWCNHHSDGSPQRPQELLQEFLCYINFTNMTREELQTIEEGDMVPMKVLYTAFKNKVLGIEDSSYIPRRGAIQLQWINSYPGKTLETVDCGNHIRKVVEDGWEVTVALNRFSRGGHYWTYTIHDMKQPHDCLVGVYQNRHPSRTAKPTSDAAAVYYEPCCNRVITEWEKVQHNQLDLSTTGTEWLVIGVMVDFDAGEVQFIHHDTKTLLWTVKCSPLPPLYPCTAVRWVRNGGVTLSDTTTFPHDRKAGRRLASSGLRSPDTSRSPSKTPKKTFTFLSTSSSA